jgi:hypothetical protein
MEFNNKTLALVLVVTVVLTVFGTMYNINKLSSLHVSTLPEVPAGFAGLTDSANVTLVISKTVSIRFENSSCNWGSGQVLGSCVMETNGTGWINSTTCSGFSTVGSCILLENNGSARVSVKLNFSSNETLFGTVSSTGSLFQYNITNNESGSCGTWVAQATSPWADLGNFTQVEPVICDNLYITDTSDSLLINFKVGFNESITSGNKLLNITAIASSVE